MRVFISWSGGLSQKVAEELRDWLPSVVQRVSDVWLSSTDIPGGANWSTQIGTQLAQVDFGIICVTKENQNKPWLNFEAGAISKLQSRAVPLLIDFDSTAELEAGPLAQLQALQFNEDGIKRLVDQINTCVPEALGTTALSMAFRRGWPELEIKFNNIKEQSRSRSRNPGAKRSMEDKIDEILLTLREVVVQAVDQGEDPFKRGIKEVNHEIEQRDILAARIWRIAGELGIDKKALNLAPNSNGDIAIRFLSGPTGSLSTSRLIIRSSASIPEIRVRLTEAWSKANK